MNKGIKLLLPILLAVIPLSADTLKLRNGSVLEGHFVAGDQRSIWFQSGLEGANSYPLSFVESLSFGAVTPVPSSYSPAHGSSRMKARKMPNLREAFWLIPVANWR